MRTYDTYPHNALHKLSPFAVFLERLWRRDHLIDQIYQRFCLDPLSDEPRPIIQDVKIYQRLMSGIGDGAG